jgi:cytosine/adenosine deaminase-related metal-dependent hydrolase
MAPLLGAGAPLAVGAAADFMLPRSGAPELALGDLGSDLVYAASGDVVDTVVVAGQPLLRGGEIEELEEIVARAGERAGRLGL